MIINSYLFQKLLYSSLQTIGVIFSIFFIFSLLGNLGEKIAFNQIIYLSIFSSVQILFYIPLLIFFIIICVFLINLKSFNELVIVMHYVFKRKIIFIFFIYIFTFLSLELNKNSIIKSIDNIKTSILDLNSIINNQVFIKIDGENKIYSIINNEKLDKKTVINFVISNNSFKEAIYSTNTYKNIKNLNSNDYVKLTNNEISNHKDKIVLIENYNELSFEKRINRDDVKGLHKISYNEIFIFLYLLLVFISVLILSFDKKLIQKNDNNLNLYVTNTLLIFYSYLIISFNLGSYKMFFQLLGLLLLLIYVLKKTIHENYN